MTQAKKKAPKKASPKKQRAKASTYANPDVWLYEAIAGRQSDSGVHVNGKTSLELAAVWYCVSTIGGQLGTLPLNVHKRIDDRSNQVAHDHKAHYLMRTEPNPLMAADVFRETLQTHALLWGNGRAAITRNERNEPLSLFPLLPDRTKTVIIHDETNDTSTKWHIVTDDSGEPIPINDADVLHIQGLGYDGFEGHSVISYARESFGLSIASQKASSRHFRNNGVPGLVLEAPAGAFQNETEAQEFLRKFNEYHASVDNTSKTALLGAGITAKTLGLPARDSQWIEQRGFQRQEIMLWFLLEQIPGNQASVSYNSEEQKNLAFMTRCMNRWLVRWETECNRKLLTKQQRVTGSHFFKFNRNANLAMTANDRADFYTKMSAIRALSPNEIREREDMEPYKGGDEYANPHITPTQSNRVKQLIESRVKQIQRVEIQRALDAATSGKNFLDWLDKFYSQNGFVPQLAAAIVECGGNDEDVRAYADESKTALLSVADKATADGFGEAIQRETSKWVTRAEQLSSVLSLRN